MNQFSRLQLMMGAPSMERLYHSKVAVFGIGGVGGYAVEALARSGVGFIDLFDDDKVCLTNLNRQIIATRKTVGQYKVDVMKERILDINPDCQVGAYKLFFGPAASPDVAFSQYDYILDAVDTMTAKLELVCQAYAAEVPIISSMGAANKLDSTAFRVTDIYKTTFDPLARIMRKELRKRGIPSLKVVFSEEPALPPREEAENSCRSNCVCPPGAARTCTHRRQIPASNAFVPSVAGLIMAGEVIKDLTGVTNRQTSEQSPGVTI
jgi:tRNA A37 threonylcarbamoyladenosine dehydratase